MTKKFYSLDELYDALVYDSEGLFYGYVCGAEFTSSGIAIKVCIKYSREDLVPDIDRLRKILVERGVSIQVNSPLEYLVERARQEGIEIPLMKVEKELVFVKGLVDVKDIVLIDSVYVEDERGKRRVTLVLLRTPRETLYRGASVQTIKPLPTREHLEKKLVVSISKGILGFVREVVIGPGEIGIRVSKSIGTKGYISWIGFLRELRSKGYIEYYEELANYIDPFRNARIDISRLKEIEDKLLELDSPKEIYNILRKHIVIEKSSESYEDIPWSHVLKVRDIIIVK